jgi:hypothetical protein
MKKGSCAGSQLPFSIAENPVARRDVLTKTNSIRLGVIGLYATFFSLAELFRFFEASS